MVDQVAFDVVGNEFNLSLKQRKILTGIIHRPCKMDDKVMKISTAIELMVDSYKTALSENDADLVKLPILIDFKENLECES